MLTCNLSLFSDFDYNKLSTRDLDQTVWAYLVYTKENSSLSWLYKSLDKSMHPGCTKAWFFLRSYPNPSLQQLLSSSFQLLATASSFLVQGSFLASSWSGLSLLWLLWFVAQDVLQVGWTGWSRSLKVVLLFHQLYLFVLAATTKNRTSRLKRTYVRQLLVPKKRSLLTSSLIWAAIGLGICSWIGSAPLYLMLNFSYNIGKRCTDMFG